MTMVIFYCVLIYLLLGTLTALFVLIRPKIILDDVYQESLFRTRLVLMPGMIVLWPIILIAFMRPKNRQTNVGSASGGADHE